MPYRKTCPYCGEALRPDDATKSVRCDACGAQFAPGELREQTEEELLRLLKQPDQTTNGLGGFVCGNCGARLIADEAAAAAFCCFCGAPALEAETIRDAVEPDWILPFAIDRREAQSRFVHRFRAKKLIEPGVVDAAKAGHISGVYVPFWLLDATLETHWHAVSSPTETERGEQNETVTARHFCHYRRTVSAYKTVPADASERIDGRLMNLLGPFDLSQLVPFDPALSKDFFAEANTFTAEQTFQRVREQLEADALRAARDAAESQSYAETKSCRHLYQSLSAQYALLPVWILTCRAGGYAQAFFMNGQTGKIVGEAPLSLTRALQWFGGVTAAVAAAGELIWFTLDKFLK